MPLSRLRDFAERWSEKPKQISGDGTLHTFLDYLATFREAKGAIVEESDEDNPTAVLEPADVQELPLEDAVQLMTIHAAKGLEFRCVFILNVVSNYLPAKYKESLVGFPPELRSRSAAQDADPKTQHEHEERRLFYVAMTRAMDHLYLCGKAGSSKGEPIAPSKYMRELVNARAALRGAIECSILPQDEIIRRLHAAADPVLAVSQWTQVPARSNRGTLDLSASAIQKYEECPLAYKLHYDWRLPEDATAPLQFGNAMHLALKAYFDGVRAGRPPDEATVLACFLDEFNKSSIAEPLQRELYEQAGREQLATFLRSELAQPGGRILHTEKRFSVEIAGARVHGRLDRLDSLSGNDVVVIDYKTGRLQTQEDADKSLQLSVYALAAQSMGHNPASLVLINTLNSSAIESCRTPDQLREAEARVGAVAARIMAGEFDPNPKGPCNRCAYQSICPEHEEPLPRPAAAHAVSVH